MATRKPKGENGPSFNLPDRPGFARALGEKLGVKKTGRASKLREGERARGDAGGGKKEHEHIDVPHGTDEHAPSDET